MVVTCLILLMFVVIIIILCLLTDLCDFQVQIIIQSVIGPLANPSMFAVMSYFLLFCFIVSLGVEERAEYHVMSHPQTFPRGLAPDYRGVSVGTTLGRRSKNLFTRQVSLTPSRPLHKATAVFGHAGGRLVVPNTGEPTVGKFS